MQSLVLMEYIPLQLLMKYNKWQCEIRWLSSLEETYDSTNGSRSKAESMVDLLGSMDLEVSFQNYQQSVLLTIGQSASSRGAHSHSGCLGLFLYL